MSLPRQSVEQLLSKCLHSDAQAFISTVNLGEIWYTSARKTSAFTADRTVDDIMAIGIKVVAMDWPLTRSAADFKSRFRMSFADAFAAALTRSLGADAELATGDFEFRAVEKEIRVHWLRAPGA